MQEEEKTKYEMRKLAREMMKDSPSLFFNVIRFEHAQRVAAMLAKSTMVPEHFRNNLGNVMIALNYADRLNMDPYMLMQTMYVVHGKPGIEGKALIALINRSGLFDGPLEWEFTGKKGTDEWTCTAYATNKQTGRKLEMSISWATVAGEQWNYADKKDKYGNLIRSKWNTMPEQMFRYRAASWFANAYCPEVKLGMQTIEELQDTIEMTPQPNGVFSAGEPNIKAATEAKLAEIKQRLIDNANKPAEAEAAPPPKEGPAPEESKQEPPPVPQAPPEKPKSEIADSHPLARDKWIRLKGPGFRAIVEDNEDCIVDLPLKLFSEMARKWMTLYEEEFPYNVYGEKRNNPPQEDLEPAEDAHKENPEEREAAAIKADILSGYEGQYKEALARLGVETGELPNGLDELIAVQEMCAVVLAESQGNEDDEDRF